MVRFIFTCMAIIIVSFAAMPIVYGVAEQRERLTQTAAVDSNGSDELSFEEIFALASGNPMPDAGALNAIEPATGDIAEPDQFSNGFSNKEDSALADSLTDSKEEALIPEEEVLF